MPEETTEGGALRSKLEEALAANTRLQQENSSLTAGNLIREKGLTLVKPEDLAGVDREDMADHAASLQSAAEDNRKNMIRSLFTDLEGDALDTAVNQVLAGAVPAGVVVSEDAASAATIHDIGKVGGTPLIAVDKDFGGLEGLELIRAGVAATAKARAGGSRKA